MSSAADGSREPPDTGRGIVVHRMAALAVADAALGLAWLTFMEAAPLCWPAAVSVAVAVAWPVESVLLVSAIMGILGQFGWCGLWFIEEWRHKFHAACADYWRGLKERAR